MSAAWWWFWFSPPSPLCMGYGVLLKTRNASGFDLVFWSLWSHCPVWKILDRVCRLYAGKHPHHHRELRARPWCCNKLTAQPSRINVQFLCLWMKTTSASPAYAKRVLEDTASPGGCTLESPGRGGGGGFRTFDACVPPPEILVYCWVTAWMPEFWRAAQVTLMCIKVLESLP